jgi:hypothetical protein
MGCAAASKGFVSENHERNQSFDHTPDRVLLKTFKRHYTRVGWWRERDLSQARVGLRFYSLTTQFRPVAPLFCANRAFR